MAKLPDVTAARPAPRPSRGIASVSNAGAVGAAMQQFGDTVNVVGMQILDREATAQAKDADALAADKIRALLYDPETGFANLSGGAAVAARDNINKQLDALSGELTSGMSNGARRKLEDSLRGRVERAKGTVDGHTSTQRRNWINGASEARVSSAYQDSLVDPSATATSLGIIESEYRGMAAREGWSADELNQKLGTAKSKVHAGIVERIALVDPQAAVGYLAENRGNMVGSDVISLEAKLIPMAKEWEGRKLGATAALSGVSGDYLASIRSAESGGNDAAKNPNSTATGRYQFLAGTWSEMMARHPELGLTVDGRTDPAQNEIAIRAFTADNAKALSKAGITATNGNLYAAHFLGAVGATTVLAAPDNALVSDLVAPGVVTANGFLTGMTVSDFKAWSARKGGGNDVGYSQSSGDIGELLAIKDPTTRAAALDEYKLRSAVADGQRKAVQAAAGNAAFQAIESGGRIDDLTFEQKASIGQDGMTSLRAYERSVASGVPVETKPAIYMMLKQMQYQDPERFRSINLLAYSDALSESDRKAMLDTQAKSYDRSAGVAASSLMSVATNQLRGIGIKANDPKEALVQTSLLKWQESYIGQNGKEPTSLEIDQKVGRLLMEVVIDPPGLMNKATGNAFEASTFKIDEAGLVEGDIKIGDTDVPPSVVQEQVAAMKAAGQEVTAETLINRLIDLMEGGL